MTASAFIASLVGSLAWPAVIVVILAIFHRQFGTMLDRLARVRLGSGAASGSGGEADPAWSQAEAAVRQSLAAARPPLAAVPAGGPARPGGPRRAGQPGAGQPGSGPAGAGESVAGGAAALQQALVEERWQALASELREVITRSGAAGTSQLAGAGFEQLMDTTLRAGLLDSATVRSLDGLAHLRRAPGGLRRSEFHDLAGSRSSAQPRVCKIMKSTARGAQRASAAPAGGAIPARRHCGR
jgi:hypothetical protein